jgi:hypothetical protein
MVDKDYLLLSCRRVGDNYDGELVSHNDTLSTVETFVGATYAKMMTLVHLALVRSDRKRRLYIHRPDSPMGATYELPPSFVDIIRQDPTLFINSTSLDRAEVKKTKEVVRDSGCFRTGYDTLADAFGESVYLGYHQAEHAVEGPLSGRWVVIGEEKLRTFWFEDDGVSISAAWPGGQLLPGGTCRWATVKVEDLLATKRNRFFLPRMWNPKPWISCDELASRLEKFRQDKASAERELES